MNLFDDLYEPSHGHPDVPCDERDAVIAAVRSAAVHVFDHHHKVAALRADARLSILPTIILSRDLSTQIEKDVPSKVPTFKTGHRQHGKRGNPDLLRYGHRWEVKCAQQPAFIVNQSAVIDGEHYLAIQYSWPDPARVMAVCGLYDAREDMFAARKPHMNLRQLTAVNMLDYWWRWR